MVLKFLLSPLVPGSVCTQVGPSGQGARVVDAPLCREDCEQWWADCHSSYTCKADWHGGWDWSRGERYLAGPEAPAWGQVPAP